MAVTLVREPLDLADDNSRLDQLYTLDQLAQDAAERLGYTLLLHQLSWLRADAEKGLPLKRAIAELGIQPFSRRSVEQYQAEMAYRATPLRTRALRYLEASMALLFCAGAAVFVVSFLVGIGFSITATIIPTWLWTTCLASILTVFACLMGFMNLENKKATFAEWDSIPISKYECAIPEFALQTAVDLQAKCPEAQLSIEELKFKKQRLDPFLVADDSKGNRYYLEVWNEPSFTQKR